MGSLNKTFLIGRVGQNLELKTTPNGTSVVNFSLATTEFYKDQSGQKQNRTEWHKLVAYQRTAEILNQYCGKGSQIFVEGALQTREWADKNGNKRWTTEVIIRNLQLLDNKQEGGGAPSTYQQTTPPSTDLVEDDMPF